MIVIHVILLLGFVVSLFIGKITPYLLDVDYSAGVDNETNFSSILRSIFNYNGLPSVLSSCLL
jgi:hypothetical protein